MDRNVRNGALTFGTHGQFDKFNARKHLTMSDKTILDSKLTPPTLNNVARFVNNILSHNFTLQPCRGRGPRH